jgi:hypothetical protein
VTDARRHLAALWDALEGLGASVVRLDPDALSDDDVANLVSWESRRLRVLTRDAAAPGPVDRRSELLDRLVSLVARAVTGEV